MNLILDTHALLWWLLADPRLPGTAQALIRSVDATRYVSAVSAFEIANKVRSGKLEIAREIANRFGEICAVGNFTLLDIRSDHALLAGRLSGTHRDPFDRLLAAQSQIEKVPVLTSDDAFPALGAKTVW